MRDFPLCPISRLHDAITAGDAATAAGAAALLARAFADEAGISLHGSKRARKCRAATCTRCSAPGSSGTTCRF